MRVPDLDKHVDSYTCKQGQTRRGNEIKQDNQFQADSVKFLIQGIEIERVHYFKYLGRIMTDNDSDTMCIDANIKKARQQWFSISKILKREGANAVCMARFYITVVQSVLLYGSESWSIDQKNMIKLQSFHNRALRYMTGSHIRKYGEEWNYPEHENF